MAVVVSEVVEVDLGEVVAAAKEIVGRFLARRLSRRAEAAGSILGRCHAGRMTLRARGPRAFLLVRLVCRKSDF